MSMIVIMLTLVKFSILYCKVQSFVVTLQKNKRMRNGEWGMGNEEWDILFKYIFLIIILNCI
jgi:hypothetical protein